MPFIDGVGRGAHYGTQCRYRVYTHISPLVLEVACNRGNARGRYRCKFKVCITSAANRERSEHENSITGTEVTRSPRNPVDAAPPSASS
ncbi:hypothetical protein SFRURICE_003677, partial [Spodoptera frugiperda]